MNPRAAPALLSLILCAPALVWTADLLASTPALVLAAASAPAALITALIIFAQRGGGRPSGALLAALLWGAVGAAFVATTGNEVARHWLTALAGDGARSATALLVAPALEESAKALGLVLLVVLAPASVRSARDGIVYGALIGVGFVWTENFLYLGVSMLQGGEEGLLRALYLRGVVGASTHGVFTACSGAAVGWWASGALHGRSARAAPAGGVLVSIAQHVAWNALAAPMIASALCAAPTAGGACIDPPTSLALFGTATLLAAVFLTPGVVLVTAAWRSEAFRHRAANRSAGA